MGTYCSGKESAKAIEKFYAVPSGLEGEMRASASPLVPVHKLEAVKAGGGKEKANFFFFFF